MDNGELEADKDGERVREYSADGYIAVDHVGDEYIVKSRGRNPSDQWTKRVPAERTAVVEEEKLWAIPANWEPLVGLYGGEKVLYHVPGTGVDVVVDTPGKDHVVDAWYRVSTVGQSKHVYTGSGLDHDALVDLIQNRLEDEKIPLDEYVIALAKLEREWDEFEEAFIEDVHNNAGVLFSEEYYSYADDRHIPNLNGTTTDQWEDHYPISQILRKVMDVDRDLVNHLEGRLRDYKIVPHYPEVKLKIKSGVNLPNRYTIRALEEAGCSPTEVLDYIRTEIDGLSQTERAEERGVNQSNVSRSVGSAQAKLGE